MTPEDLLAQAHVLLLDFDGPVCSVFAGLPAPRVADQLRDVLGDWGHANLPETIASSADPFDVFRYAAALGDDEARCVESAFAAHEVEAISSATPTPGAHQLMEAWHEAGQPLAIVSNNGVAAINAYLDLYGIRASIDFVSARANSAASLLKPSPHLLREAIRALGVRPDDCVFLGDSVTDIVAAEAAGTFSIGYANKPGKSARLKASGADAITNTLTGLVAVA